MELLQSTAAAVAAAVVLAPAVRTEPPDADNACDDAKSEHGPWRASQVGPLAIGRAAARDTSQALRPSGLAQEGTR